MSFGRPGDQIGRLASKLKAHRRGSNASLSESQAIELTAINKEQGLCRALARMHNPFEVDGTKYAAFAKVGFLAFYS